MSSQLKVGKERKRGKSNSQLRLKKSCQKLNPRSHYNSKLLKSLNNQRRRSQKLMTLSLNFPNRKRPSNPQKPKRKMMHHYHWMILWSNRREKRRNQQLRESVRNRRKRISIPSILTTSNPLLKISSKMLPSKSSNNNLWRRERNHPFTQILKT